MNSNKCFLIILFFFTVSTFLKAQNAGFAVLVSGGGNQSNSQTLSDTAYQGKKAYRLEISSPYNSAYITYRKSIFALSPTGEKKVDSTFSLSIYFRVSNAQVPLNVEMQLLNKKGNVASTAKESLRLSNTDWRKTILTFSTKDTAVTSIVFALSFPQGVSGTNALFIDDIWYQTNKDTLWWDDCDNLFTNMGPDPPTNISIKNGQKELPSLLYISWSPVHIPWVQGYYAKVKRDTTTVINELVQDTVFSRSFDRGTTYEFTIATYTGMKGWYSRPIYFTIAIIPIPVELVFPLNNSASVATKNVVLKWKKLDNAVSYDVNLFMYKLSDTTHTRVFFQLLDKNIQDTSFVLNTLLNDTSYYWRVRERNAFGEIGPWSPMWQFTTEKLVSVEKIKIPYTFQLYQNYPNPFNPSTAISYQLPAFGKVVLEVYDLLGRKVAILIDEEQPAGNYKIKFSGANLPSGVYFYRLQARSYSQTKKLLVIK